MVTKYFDATIAKGPDVKSAANWIMGDIAAYMKNKKLTIDEIKLTPQILFKLLVKGGTVKGLIDEKDLVQASKTDPYVIYSLGDQAICSKKNSQTTVIGPLGEPIWNQSSYGEILLRLTYKAYVEDEEDDKAEAESTDIDALDCDDELPDSYVKEETEYSKEADKASFMDVLAALIVSEEFRGIVAS
ncbi:hypothetical protein FEM48_Zijuj07G0009800 [Ziziphus jujuba var. spinosa]|uniref:Asn/Gln amidotransferase domain-containing protein n=1 Tax=Ziziphus jujuba var. spinosa TaxID=714518 RepID=A0A978V1I4_ZIZJJ|nr:hypothetical protein FEM48_Zijuj07G0009800 [Ziziphus jujuba var. spinosa]